MGILVILIIPLLILYKFFGKDCANLSEYVIDHPFITIITIVLTLLLIVDASNYYDDTGSFKEKYRDSCTLSKAIYIIMFVIYWIATSEKLAGGSEHGAKVATTCLCIALVVYDIIFFIKIYLEEDSISSAFDGLCCMEASALLTLIEIFGLFVFGVQILIIIPLFLLFIFVLQ